MSNIWCEWWLVLWDSINFSIKCWTLHFLFCWLHDTSYLKPRVVTVWKFRPHVAITTSSTSCVTTNLVPLQLSLFSITRVDIQIRITYNGFTRWLQYVNTWWRHQMETFFALLALCAGNSLVTTEFPSQRPVMRSFDVFFDLRLNKRLSKQSGSWWFETPSRSFSRQCNIRPKRAFTGYISHWWNYHQLSLLMILTPCRCLT